MRSARLVAFLLLAGCGRPAERSVELVSETPLGALRVEPEAALRHLDRVGPRRARLRLKAGTAVTIHSEAGCPVELPAGEASGRRRVQPWIRVEPVLPQVGWGRPFAVQVEPGCEAARRGQIHWRQLTGQASPLKRSERGFRIEGRMPPRPRRALPWGVVPVSPATRGTVVLEATWTDGRHRQRRTVEVHAAARATGLPSLAVGQRVTLGGSGWHLVDPPPGQRAILGNAGDHAEFLPLGPGRWVLEDGAGRRLRLSALRHDASPLDCGRAGCHAEAAQHFRDNPMGRAFYVDLETGRTPDPTCALACHTVGEPGLPDGGFVHLLRTLDAPLPPPGPGAWAKLPRVLRRAGGVGCTACHGPGSIPERDARWAVLRVGLCATCHDAPPRYRTVGAWRKSAKAGSDADPSTRAGACAGCHTVWGYLDRLGVRKATPPPPQVGGIGLGCATCHAPHGPHAERLLRTVPSDLPGLPTAADRLCASCHASGPWAGASQANLVLGVGGVEPATGAPLEGPAPHAAAGCVGCHDPHSLDVDPQRCTACHGTEGPEVPPLPSFGAVPRGVPPWHGRPDAAAGSDAAARAAWNRRLLAADPAAAVHNPAYAQRLARAAALAPERPRAGPP